jgi:hypothetical protein
MWQKIAVIAAMIHSILFFLYGNCRDKMQALPDYMRALHVPRLILKLFTMMMLYKS